MRRRSLGLAVSSALLAATLTACVADPPPAVPGSETSAPPQVPTTTGTTVQVAIDGLGAGFNPHLASNSSAAARALAAMTLPSVFREAQAPDGRVTLTQNTDLIPTIEQPAPLQIAYTIRQDAQWSDGAPIAAEDFVYLWQSMITAPDTVGSAPYRQIESVASGAGGKRVIVTLKAPLPGWRTLFQNLLPSHLVKGSPGGFNGAMREKIPASGAGYLVKKVDVARDEVTLERNDRYWMKPALVDRIVLRKGGSDTQLANSVRTGDVQVVSVHGGPSLLAQLTSIYQVRAIEQVDPRVLSLTLNTRSKFLTDVAVRRALLDAVNVDLLTTVGSGGDTVRPARAQVLAPSDPGYAPTMPPRPPAAEAKAKLEKALAAAGYSLQTAPIPPSQSVPPTPPPPTGTADPSTSADPSALPVPPSPSPGESVQQYVRDGVPMFLRIGVPQGNVPAFAVASNATDQLRAMGVFASVVALDPQVVAGTALLDGAVDAVVGWSGTGPTPVERFAARVACPAPPSQDSGRAATTTPAAPNPENDPAATTVGGNLAGLCDADLQDLAHAGLRGDALDLGAIDADLWSRATVLPILQDVTLSAVGPTVQGVTLEGPPQDGVFSGVEGWARK
ncbi:ABC transporter family substrate-binding protein [Tsukamurella spumae]|uniref:ABC transporter family substrate-binding protein n=1 Tax=Tsukamurella spumae TaxID=44753 RepID=A0A846X2W2_9ACTN|nr:ABC transporter family substrate-binding protein [Tsukamurella spumae]NKY18552.1 ABC transporter family substrate-binding protein [Tsukamurella spumae]